MAIPGSGAVLAPGTGLAVRPGGVEVRFPAPIDGGTAGASRRVLIDRAEAAVLAGLAQTEPEATGSEVG